jgi:hypothetical protein
MGTDTLLNTVRAFNRCETLSDFRGVLLEAAPDVIESDAFGVYFFDTNFPSAERFAGNAPRDFLLEYETLRPTDPILQSVLRDRHAEDGSHLLGRAWGHHPLCLWMEQWGWEYSLQGPLLIDGRIVGTLNFARGRALGRFNASTRRAAQFICEESGVALGRALRLAQLDRRPTAIARAKPGRRTEILGMLIEGRQNKWIAWRLGISIDTVKYHVKRLYADLGVSSRLDLQRIPPGAGRSSDFRQQ